MFTRMDSFGGLEGLKLQSTSDCEVTVRQPCVLSSGSPTKELVYHSKALPTTGVTKDDQPRTVFQTVDHNSTTQPPVLRNDTSTHLNPFIYML